MIAAVVVTFSAPADVLDRCLRALCEEGGLDRIVVVDTGGSAQVASDLAGGVELLQMENRGYGAAVNLASASIEDASIIVALNDDVVVHSGWLPPLVAELAPSDVGAAQPALIDPDDGAVASLGVVLDRYGAGSDIADGQQLPVDRSPTDISIFTGGAAAFDVRFLRSTGGFDERLFLYYEDVDLALRGRALGWRYRVVPESTVEHRRGTSTGARVEETRFYQERNRVWMAVRHGSPATAGRALWLSLRRMRQRPRRVHARALLSALTGTPRFVVERVRSARKLEIDGSSRRDSGRCAP